MFILKKGHQPGVYVPLRALFLVCYDRSPCFLMAKAELSLCWTHRLDCLSLVLRNRSSGFPTRSYANRAGQPQRIARGLKYQIYEV